MSVILVSYISYIGIRLVLLEMWRGGQIDPTPSPFRQEKKLPLKNPALLELKFWERLVGKNFLNRQYRTKYWKHWIDTSFRVIFSHCNQIYVFEWLCTTIIFIIFWDFLMFYQILFSPQVKRYAEIKIFP